MLSRTRYSLIIAGLIFFAVGAPLLVLYIQGKNFSFQHRRTQLTGILSVETKPSGATVLVNGEKKGESPDAVRFLNAGDHIVTVSKQGFHTWEKRLAIVAGKVTYAALGENRLLLIKNEASQPLATNAVLSAVLNQRVAYTTTTNQLVITSLGTDAPAKTLPLPAAALQLTADDDGTHLLVAGAQYVLVVHAETGEIADYSKLFSNSKHLTTHNGRVWGLSQDNELITHNSTERVVAAQDVLAYRAHDAEIYYLQTAPDGSVLRHANIGAEGLLQTQTLGSGLPAGKTASIYIDAAKALYLLMDSTLWRVNNTATQLESNVTAVTTTGGVLAYTTPGELLWYDSNSNKSRLVSRSSEPYTQFFLDPSLQYAFFVQGGALVALELDDRSSQNRYILDSTVAPSTGPNIQFMDQDTLLYHSGNTLKSLTIL